MNDNSSFSPNTNAQFALSYELLHLLQWLSRNNPDKLKKIVDKAVSQGLHDEIQRFHQQQDSAIAEDKQTSVIEFFELLDDLLFDAINEHVEKKARQQNLLPPVDLIDSALCDSMTVRSSVEKTTHTLDKNPHINAQEQLFKELLKQWKPFDKYYIN